MAYAVLIVKECTEPRCSAQGTYEVRNQRNETIRICCRRHADALVRRVSQDEEDRLR